MDRDLNLSGAFGGLRITNPDDASDASPPAAEQQKNLEAVAQATTPLSHSGSTASQVPTASEDRTGSFLGFDPSSFSTDVYTTELSKLPSQAVSESETPTEPIAPPQRATYSPNYPTPSPRAPTFPEQQQQQQQQPLPPSHQRPQQQQYSQSQPSRPPMAPRQLSRSTSHRNGQRPPPNQGGGYSPNPAAASAAHAAMSSQRQYQNGGRPMSTSYGPGHGLPPRDSNYRFTPDQGQGGGGGAAAAAGPRRVKSQSRKELGVAQAGVLIDEKNHQERNYGSRPPVYGGNVVPPRRQGSRGVLRPRGDTQHSASSSPYPAGSPYALENGPPPSSEEWQEKGAAVRVMQTTDNEGRPVTRYTKKGVKDFKFGKLLGEGSYSQVHLAQDRTTLTEYAIKVLDKRHIIKEKKVKYVNIEKDTLNRLTNHPGVVRLYYTFQDERSLYFVLDFAANGELLGVLKQMGTFDEECTRYYAAQLLDTIEYMHSRGVIHRDLKPENILLDKDMHTKITDFGTAKILSEAKRSRASSSGTNGTGLPPGAMPDAPPPPGPDDGDRANSFVGTAEYVSPELLTEKSACKASDLWAYGCIVYQLLAGRPPFKAANEYLTFQKIIKLDYRFPPNFPPAARDLVERCLVLDPRQRLTIEHIKNHDFFRGMTFGKNLWQQKPPALKPYVPPMPAPIRLNSEQRVLQQQQQLASGDGAGGALDGNGNFVTDIKPSHSTRPVHLMDHSPRTNKTSKRPSPRVITDVPPPSQLDIEWSPVLSKDNERILKCGNLAVVAGSAKDIQAGHKHDKDGKEEGGGGGGGGGGAFKRFFGGGGALKKKTRMVIATSNGRLLIANSPDEKKLKFETNLLAEGTSWMKCLDSKGLAYWCLETKDKHYTFEDPKHSSSDISHTTALVQEWLDALDRARDVAFGMQSAGGSASGYSSLLVSPAISKSPTLNFGDRSTGGGGGNGPGGPGNDSTSAFSASNFSVGGGSSSAYAPGGGYSAAASANDLSSSRYAAGGSHPPGSSSGGGGGLIEQATNATGAGSSTAAMSSSAGSGRNLLHKPRDGAGGADNQQAGTPSAAAGGAGVAPGTGEGEEANNNGKGGGMSRGFKRFSKRQSKSGLAAVF